MNAYYFAEDGSWGSAENIIILDEDATAHFTSAMWDRIQDAGENERLEIVEHFRDNDCVTNDYTGYCDTCGLTADEVNSNL